MDTLPVLMDSIRNVLRRNRGVEEVKSGLPRTRDYVTLGRDTNTADTVLPGNFGCHQPISGVSSFRDVLQLRQYNPLLCLILAFAVGITGLADLI
jgi:hypothetical protein